MAQVELIMPKMGESVAEATIIKWLKEEGDSIELEESVLEIATDKVDSEVPSPSEGILKKKLFGEDDVVKVGEAIAIIETEAGDSPTESDSDKAQLNGSESHEPKESPAASEAQKMVAAATETAGEISRNSNGRFYSPL
ncbi:MAG: biotin/lipoyl-containing protein, partial [Owenweeksia sp.]